MEALIKRSTVVDVLKETGIIQDNDLGHLVIEEINRIPVAYDTEKVMEQIEVNAITDALAVIYLAQHKIPFVSKRKALEIIESGGVIDD